MKIRYSVRFTIRPYGKGKEKYQICVRVTFNGNQKILTTGERIDSIQAWDSLTMRVVSGYVGEDGRRTSDINSTLQKITEDFEIVFKFFEVNDQYPAMDDVIKKYNERRGVPSAKSANKNKKAGASIVSSHPEQPQEKKDDKFTFWEAYEAFVLECGEKNAWTPATHSKFAALKKDILTYKRQVKFEDINETWLTGFVAYLRDKKKLSTPRSKKIIPTLENPTPEPRKHDDEYGIKNSTIEKKLGYFRWFMKWATIKKYNTSNDYLTFKPTLKRTQKKVIYLSREELKQIVDCQIPSGKKYLERVRDVFLFCCFTGIRYSDAYNLRKNDVKDDHIEITTVKTADSLIIELNKMSRSILDKYKDVPLENNKALPVISNQPMNIYLKELCELAGINEEVRITTYKGNVRTDTIKPKYKLIGTHTGRRSFIVNALSRGISPNIVMRWTGHSDYTAMKPYIDIVDSIKASEMSKMDFMD